MKCWRPRFISALRAVSCAALSCQLMLAPAAHASSIALNRVAAVQTPKINQFFAVAQRRYQVANLEYQKKGPQAFVDALAPLAVVNQPDRAALLKILRGLPELPRMDLVDRGYSLTFKNQKKVTVVVQNYETKALLVNGVPMVFDEALPLDVAAEQLQRIIQPTLSRGFLNSSWDLLVPSANASIAIPLLAGAGVFLIAKMFFGAGSQASQTRLAQESSYVAEPSYVPAPLPASVAAAAPVYNHSLPYAAPASPAATPPAPAQPSPAPSQPNAAAPTAPSSPANPPAPSLTPAELAAEEATVKAETLHRSQAFSVARSFCKSESLADASAIKTAAALDYFQPHWKPLVSNVDESREGDELADGDRVTMSLHESFAVAPEYSRIRPTQFIKLHLKKVNGVLKIESEKNNVRLEVDCASILQGNFVGTHFETPTDDALTQKHPDAVRIARENIHFDSLKNAVCYRYFFRNNFPKEVARTWEETFKEYFGQEWIYKASTPDNRVGDLANFLENQNTMKILPRQDNPSLPSRPYIVVSRSDKTKIQLYQNSHPVGPAQVCDDKAGTYSNSFKKLKNPKPLVEPPKSSQPPEKPSSAISKVLLV